MGMSRRWMTIVAALCCLGASAAGGIGMGSYAVAGMNPIYSRVASAPASAARDDLFGIEPASDRVLATGEVPEATDATPSYAIPDETPPQGE